MKVKTFTIPMIAVTVFIFLTVLSVSANTEIDRDQDRDLDGLDLFRAAQSQVQLESFARNFGTEYRSFLMAAAPYRLEVEPYNARTEFDFTGFSQTVDAVSLHMDGFFGTPWDEIREDIVSPPIPPTPPWHQRSAAWYAKMVDIRDQVQALGGPVYLSVTPLNGLRNSLGSKAVDNNGELVVIQNWYSGGCYDFDADPENIRDAYKVYVAWMVDFFSPDFLTHAIEANLYLRQGEGCPQMYDSLVRLMNEVYEQEKEKQPGLPIFPSFTAAHMWGYGGQGACEIGDRTCLAASIARQEAVKRDRWAISAYPIFLQWEFKDTPEMKMPDDYFSAFAELTGERVVFAETGQGSFNVEIPWPTLTDDCLQYFLWSSDTDQQAYMEKVFKDANAFNSDLVVWWSVRDFLFQEILTQCPFNGDPTWRAVYQAVYDMGLLGAWIMWGSMGALDYHAQEKPAYPFWESWLEKPFIPLNN